MFRDGIYSICYDGGDIDCPPETALAVMRDGRIVASDPNGGVYISERIVAVDDNRGLVSLGGTLPPDGMTVTGLKTGPHGAEIQLVGVFHAAADAQRATVEIAGVPVDIDITYLGPLPNRP